MGVLSFLETISVVVKGMLFSYWRRKGIMGWGVGGGGREVAQDH